MSNKYNIIIFGGPNEKEIAADIEKGLIETIEWFKKKENLTHYTNKNYNI